jgi:hypothetical protein
MLLELSAICWQVRTTFASESFDLQLAAESSNRALWNPLPHATLELEYIYGFL